MEGLKDIYILGAGTGGINLVKQIRSQNSNCKIKIIDEREYYFPKKDFISLLANSKKKRVVYLKDFANQWKVEFINAKVEKINFDKRKITFKKAEPLSFYNLVVCCGLKSRHLSIKGIDKQGVFFLSQMDPLVVRRLLKNSQDIIIYVSTFVGIQLAFLLASLGKEVKVISDSLSFLGEYKTRILSFFSAMGVDVYCGVTIEEIVGEREVRATKISLPKIFASQLVFIDSGFSPKRDCWKEDLQINGFFTKYEGVYLLGDVLNEDIQHQHFLFFNEEEVIHQTKLLGRSLVTQEQVYYKREKNSKEISFYIEKFLKLWEEMIEDRRNFLIVN